MSGYRCAALALAFMWLSGCGGESSRAETMTPDGAAGAGAAGVGATGAGVAGSVTLRPMVCPDGNEPGSDLAIACPEAMPVAGSCCGKAGLACKYPGDDSYHDLALCIDDGQHAAFWQQTVAFDRTKCRLDGRLSDLGIDAAACDARTVEPCEPEGTTTPQELLSSQLGALVAACGDLPPESQFEVTFEGGCATRMSESFSGPVGSHEELLACIRKALDAHRFACAEQLECAQIERSTLK